MGAIGGLVGLSGGAAGTGFSGPASASITNGTTADQIQQAYGGNQAALAQQQALLSALQGQNGIGNQTAVYNQLQNVANGQGPNPAQAMLAQATGANTANQAALMAGQRGAGQNVGLIARQAAQQGAANQQNAAGQAATMQAQQSLGALGQLQGLATNQVGQQIGATTGLTQAQQSEQGILQNALAAQNTANVQMQSNINNANSNLAQTTMGGQQKIIGGIGQAGAAIAGLAHGGKVPHYAAGTPDGTISSPSLGANTNLGPASSFSQFLRGWSGGNKPQSNQQPEAEKQKLGTTDAKEDPLQKGVADLFTAGAKKAGIGAFKDNSNTTMPDDSVAGDSNNFEAASLSSPDMGAQFNSGAPTLMQARGGKVPAMVSPGEIYLPPRKVKEVADGKSSPLDGEKIKGKAKVKGDSLKNDTVPKTLEEGGIVLPRSVTQSKNPHWAAHKFVSAIMAKEGLKGKKK